MIFYESPQASETGVEHLNLSFRAAVVEKKQNVWLELLTSAKKLKQTKENVNQIYP